jgi:NADPH-dependent glutamate synthase beta subunit-like oxidoreductase
MITPGEFVTAIAAAAASLPQLERFTRTGTTQRISVIGCGLAGLGVAYELQALGQTVTGDTARSREHDQAMNFTRSNQ